MIAPTMTLKSVTAGYGLAADAVRAVSCRFGPGLTLITGPNGSGKSTLLEILASNVLPRTGTAMIGSSSVTNPQTRLLRTYVPHDVGLIPALSLREHLILAAPAVDALALATEVDHWGLGDWMDAPVEDLSTGNRRKAWLLLCLLEPMDFILLDEPFNGLDADAVAHLAACIHDWVAGGRAIVLVSHTMPPSLISAASHVLQMREGKLHD